MIFKVIPEEKQLLVEEKDADNIRRVLCKVVLRIKFVLLQVPSRLFWFAPVIFLLLLKGKSRNITKHLMSDPEGNS